MLIAVEVVYAEPNLQLMLPVHIKDGATIQDLLSLPIVTAKFTWLNFNNNVIAGYAVGVFGAVQSLDYVLNAGDRVEIYRSLPIDPKEARRKRAKDAKKAAKAR